MESNPLISVGIPTYNRPEGLAETLRRITQQSYRNLEIIVSDNCSEDEAAVRKVMDEFKSDSRVTYIRQQENIRSTGNFPFLARKAKGKYFIWAADDDFLELTYVEKLAKALQANPKAAVAMAGYDVNDQMSSPPIFSVLTKHLYGLKGESAYERLKNYILQPDHLGKSRLVWGMMPTHLLVTAFDECDKVRPRDRQSIWPDFPIELWILSYGELEVVDETLYHVQLLPTSDGKLGLSGDVRKLMALVDASTKGYTSVIRQAPMEESQRKELMGLLWRYKWKCKIQLIGYYGVIGRFPRLARWIKKVWFSFT